MEAVKPFAKLVELGKSIKEQRLALGQIEQACVEQGVMDPVPRGMQGMFEVALFRVLRWLYDLDTQWNGGRRPVKFYGDDDYPDGLSVISLDEMVPSYGRELSYDENFVRYAALHFDNSGPAIKFVITEDGNKLVYGHAWDEISDKLHAPALPAQRTPPPTPVATSRKNITPDPMAA